MSDIVKNGLPSFVKSFLVRMVMSSEHTRGSISEGSHVYLYTLGTALKTDACWESCARAAKESGLSVYIDHRGCQRYVSVRDRDDVLKGR